MADHRHEIKTGMRSQPRNAAGRKSRPKSKSKSKSDTERGSDETKSGDDHASDQ